MAQIRSTESMLDKETKRLENLSNAIMVVASLIATMAFTAALTPPGGFWQDDVLEEDIRNKTTGLLKNGTYPHKAGKSIFAQTNADVYREFMVSDTIAFLLSLSVIIIIVSGLPYKHAFYMWASKVLTSIAISAIANAYTFIVIEPLSIEEKGKNFRRFSQYLTGIVIFWMTAMPLFNMRHAKPLMDELMRSWTSKPRMCTWTLVTIIWILITLVIVAFFIDSADEYHGFDPKKKSKDISWMIYFTAAIGWSSFLPIFCVVGLIACYRRSKSVMRSSKNDDNTIVV